MRLTEKCRLYSVVIKTTLHTKTGDWSGGLAVLEKWATSENAAIAAARHTYDRDMGGRLRYTSSFHATPIATHPQNLKQGEAK